MLVRRNSDPNRCPYLLLSSENAQWQTSIRRSAIVADHYSSVPCYELRNKGIGLVVISHLSVRITKQGGHHPIVTGLSKIAVQAVQSEPEKWPIIGENDQKPRKYHIPPFGRVSFADIIRNS